MSTLAYILSGLSLFICLFFIYKPNARLMFMLFFPLVAGALSHYWAIIGIAGAILGFLYNAFWAIPMGIVSAVIMILYIWGTTRKHKGFEKAFGTNWAKQISSEQYAKMTKKRWTWFLKKNKSVKIKWEKDITFWTIPGTDRELLCDIWRPSEGNTSGLAYVYLHGSAWAVGDKDYGTKFFFHHLAAQGHTVMDIAYRLIPEVDIYEMVGDAKRAVAWIKNNAEKHGVDPNKVVLGGGSAGGHIALMAGYAPDHSELTPEELKDTDVSVCSLVTFYASNDLVLGAQLYNYEKKPPVPIGTKADPKKPFEYAGRTDILLGGYPDEVPDMYEFGNPTNHVKSDSPPTLLLQGDKDTIVPIEGTLDLFAKLKEAGVPAINVVYPWSHHAFDLLFPRFSPSTQSAYYDVDRFMALIVNK